MPIPRTLSHTELTSCWLDPRWASWSIGVFICIRCSGIHRGMGTHISRVKSVDLDAWTDEQLQNVLKWGNARANKWVYPGLSAAQFVAFADAAAGTGRQNLHLVIFRRKRKSIVK